MEISNFDLIKYLDDQRISYWDRGENVSREWIGIKCPFCEDKFNHCGIHRESKFFSCWNCGEKGSIVRLIRELESCSWDKAKSRINEYREYINPEDLTSNDKVLQRPQTETIDDIFKSFSDGLPQRFINYLQGRKFEWRQILGKYKIRAALSGIYKQRIICPIYQHGQLVSFVGRDITGESSSRYRNSPNEISKIPVKSCIYNIDNASHKTVILQEGVTDVWRWGDGAVALCGEKWTHQQLLTLMEYDFNKVIIMFDPDAIARAEKLADELSSLISYVDIVVTHDGDPAEVPQSEIHKLKEELLR